MKSANHSESGRIEIDDTYEESIVTRDPDGRADMADMQELVRLLEVQRDLAIGLLKCEDLAGCLDLLLSSAMRLPGFDCGGIYLYEEATGSLRLSSHRGLSDAFVRAVSSYPADSPQARLVRSGKLVYVLPTDLSPEIAGAITAEGLHALAVLPLRDRGRITAALNISSHHHLSVEASSRVALESLVAQTEGAIVSIRARQTLQEAERQLRLAVEGAKLGTWVQDVEDGSFKASDFAKELHGVSAASELPFDFVMSTIHADDRQRVMDALEQALLCGSPFFCEYRTADAAGGERWLESNARVFEEGGTLRRYGIVQDITPRKLAETLLIKAHNQLEVRVAERTAELDAANVELSERSRRLELALEAAQAGVWSWKIPSEELEWDNRQRALFGFEDDVAVSFAECMARVHPEDRSLVLDSWQAAIMADGSYFWGNEFRIVHPVLGERWLGGMGRIQRDADGHARRIVGINFDITRRKRAEQALRESEEKYRKLHESMMDAFVSADLDGRILECNRAYQEMLGYTEDELQGMTYPEFTPEKWHAMENRMVAEQVLPHGFSRPYEKEYRRKDGSVFPVELNTFLIRDGEGNPVAMWAMVRDITERKLAVKTMQEWNRELEIRVADRTAELHRSEARFRQLAEATHEAIAVSEEGILVDGNPQLGALYGYELAEMIGRPVLDFIAPESRDKVAVRIREGNESAYECAGLHKDGTFIPLEIQGSNRMWQGRQTRITAIRDLTMAKEAAARILTQQVELSHAQRIGLLSEVSAGIIHQLSQPLCGMGANLAAVLVNLEARGENCDALKIVRDIDADVARMRDMVIHLRALANPKPPPRSRFDFNAMVESVLDVLRNEAESRGIGISDQLSRNLPQMHGDAVQLSQVVLNLGCNALDACAGGPSGRKIVAITTRHVDEGTIELCVRDPGTGLSPEVVDRLFTPFFTTKAEGLGLGLRLCRSIVEAHGGTIDGSNNPDGHGATFRVILPANHMPSYTKE